MKHINRCSPPSDFVIFVKSKPKVWSDLSVNNHTLYETCREMLAKDQNDKSGYTELPLTKKPNAWHIDHFLKRMHFPNEMFDWQNFIADNHTKGYGADYKDCNVTKEENQRLINPITEQPETFFTYRMNGEIVPQDTLSTFDKSRAELTIEKFNLNHPDLVKTRQNVADLIAVYKDGQLNEEEIIAALDSDYGLDTFVRFVLASS